MRARSFEYPPSGSLSGLLPDSRNIKNPSWVIVGQYSDATAELTPGIGPVMTNGDDGPLRSARNKSMQLSAWHPLNVERMTVFSSDVSRADPISRFSRPLTGVMDPKGCERSHGGGASAASASDASSACAS